MKILCPLLLGLFLFSGAAQAREPSEATKAYETHLEAVRSLLTAACGKAGLPFDRLGYRPRDLAMMRDEFRLGRFDVWMAEPLLFKSDFDAYGRGLAGSLTQPSRAFNLLARLQGAAFYGRADKAAFEEGKGLSSCVSALAALQRKASRDLTAEERSSAEKALSRMPEPLLHELGLFLTVAAKSWGNFGVAFDAAGLDQAGVFLRTGSVDWYDGEKGLFRQPLYSFCRRLDMKTVLFASLRFIISAERFIRYMKENFGTGSGAAPLPALDLSLPAGRIRFAGPEDTVHEKDRYLLLVDPAGNDTYPGGIGGAGFEQRLSLCMDLAGNDKYSSGEKAPPSFGAAFLGAGMLYDAGGDDIYTSHSRSQGFGTFGAGLLWDETGNDRYTLSREGQGLGAWGSGILLDTAGKDTYTCLHLAQGVGRTRGVGLLLDGDGDDAYTARDDEIVHPSAQSNKHNSSLAQGVGFGRRADFIDGHSVSGGVGLLIDVKGNDRYSGGVMAQAHGYWYGIGVLLDLDGKDSYRAAWYGQSTSAHFGLSYLRDRSGDDTYKTLISQNLGNGRDLSLSLFLDDAGNDTYTVVDRGGGAGDINGVGLFLDLAGNDTYTVRSKMTLGSGDLNIVDSLLRRQIYTVGFFLDGGGKDDYSFPKSNRHGKGIGNGKTWMRKKSRTEFSLGWDR